MLKSVINLLLLLLNNDQPPSLSNLPVVEQFIVSAIYESGMAEYDDIYAYINFTVANNFFEFENEVTGYNINLNDITKIDSVKKELSKILSYPFYVKSYRDINRHIFTWLELQQKPIPIVLGLNNNCCSTKYCRSSFNVNCSKDKCNWYSKINRRK